MTLVKTQRAQHLSTTNKKSRFPAYWKQLFLFIFSAQILLQKHHLPRSFKIVYFQRVVQHPSGI